MKLRFCLLWSSIRPPRRVRGPFCIQKSNDKNQCQNQMSKNKRWCL